MAEATDFKNPAGKPSGVQEYLQCFNVWKKSRFTGHLCAKNGRVDRNRFGCLQPSVSYSTKQFGFKLIVYTVWC